MERYRNAIRRNFLKIRMKTKFAYYNPTNGENIVVDSIEELRSALAKLAADTYINHYCGGQAYSVVEVNEDGSEKWYTPTGEARMTPDELKTQIHQMQSFIDAIQIPVAVLGGENAG